MTLEGVALGSRIVVRHETGRVGPSGGPEMTDVIGHVRALDADTVTIERHDGRIELVARATVTTWKPVPERAPRRRRAHGVSAEQLTQITSRGWPAVESHWLGEWELRASSGFTGRANSVAAAGSAGMPFARAVERVCDFYGARDLPPMAQVVVGSALHDEFSAAGWTPISGYRGGAVVQVADLRSGYAVDPASRVSPVADDEWLAAYSQAAGADDARRVLEGPEQVAFMTIGHPGVAFGRVVVTGEWAGLAAVEVLPQVRRQGYGRRIVEASLAWAIEHGADKAYLQTMRSNAAALALYAPFGFADHHDYLYLAPASH